MKYFIKYSFKRISFIYISSLLVVLLASCEDVVEVDLDAGTSKLVIDAEIVWIKGTDGKQQTIKISRMTDYYNEVVPKVSGAQVYIENSEGETFNFDESVAGFYVCEDFIPELYKNYTLYVAVDGQSFTATEQLTSVTAINKIEQRTVLDFSDEEEIEVEIFYDDPIDETNYYLSDFKSENFLYPEYILSDDSLNNGNELNDSHSDEDIFAGDTLEITHRGISQQFYNYMNLILDASSANPFAAPPANIRGNIVNQNDPNNFALGYFRLCEANHVLYVVE